MKKLIVAAAYLLALNAYAQTSTNATISPLVKDDVLLKQAENSLALSDGRIVVAYLGGLNELKSTGGSSSLTPLKVPVSNCYFAGLVEYAGYLYASCTTDWGKLTAKPYLIGARIVDDLSTMSFTVLSQPTGVYGSNNMTFDGKGSFYLSDSGITAGRILRIKLSAPLKADAPKTVYYSTQRPNGIQYDAQANALYFAENSVLAGTGIDTTAYLSKATLTADGNLTGVKRIYSAKGYFDGFTLAQGGIVMPDPLKRKVVYLDEATLTSTVLVDDIGSTSVAFRCKTCKDLVVTDAFRNAVYAITPYQLISPR